MTASPVGPRILNTLPAVVETVGDVRNLASERAVPVSRTGLMIAARPVYW